MFARHIRTLFVAVVVTALLAARNTPSRFCGVRFLRNQRTGSKVPSISNGWVRSSSGGLSRAAVWWISRIRSSGSGESATTSYLNR